MPNTLIMVFESKFFELTKFTFNLQETQEDNAAEEGNQQFRPRHTPKPEEERLSLSDFYDSQQDIATCLDPGKLKVTTKQCKLLYPNNF